MKLLYRMKSLGLSIDWAVILVAWEGVDLRTSIISSDEVIMYAANYLSEHFQEESKTLIELAILSEKESDSIKQALRRLVSENAESIEIAKRKWRLLLLIDLRERINTSNPIQGLTQLTNFWEEFGYPTDMPHVIQGRGNSLPPDSYYTSNYLKETLNKHDRWINEELQFLTTT